MANEIVYIYDEGCFGYLVQRNAYWSVVRYAKDGIEYEVVLFNNDYDIRVEEDEFDDE